MVQQVEAYNAAAAPQHRITVSVEIEKTREPLYQLFPHGDVVRTPTLPTPLLRVDLGLKVVIFQVFVSKDVARHFGFLSADAALRGFYPRLKLG